MSPGGRHFEKYPIPRRESTGRGGFPVFQDFDEGAVAGDGERPRDLPFEVRAENADVAGPSVGKRATFGRVHPPDRQQDFVRPPPLKNFFHSTPKIVLFSSTTDSAGFKSFGFMPSFDFSEKSPAEGGVERSDRRNGYLAASARMLLT